MQITAMLHGARQLEFVGVPATEVLGPDVGEEQIKPLIDKHAGPGLRAAAGARCGGNVISTRRAGAGSGQGDDS